MGTRMIIGLTVTVIVLAFVNVTVAAVPQTINYQGYLTDTGGTPVHGIVDMTFSLYTSPTGTSSRVWTEMQTAVAVANGRYSVILGSVTPLNLPFDVQYYLGVAAGSDQEMTPRQPLTSAPYAMRAYVAETVPAGSLTADRIGENCDLMQVLVKTASGWRCGSLYGVPNGTGVCIDGNCSNVGCRPGYWNIDGDAANGCEYQCTMTNGGVETCDGIDNDCNGQVDEGNVCVIASSQIQAARNAADGPVSLPISGALVTFVRAAIGGDSAGFFIQNESAGPALFIAIDPASLSPAPAAGDRVNFTITAMGSIGLLRQATAISGYARTGTGNALQGLVQNVTGATDLVSNISGYESELITLNGTIAGLFAAAGTGFVAAQADTSGISGDPNLKLRLPLSLKDAMGLEQGCAFTLNGTPLWRSIAIAEPSAWTSGDMTVTSCPAPRVTGAVAQSATAVRVTFSRSIQPSSVLANGSQFAISGVSPLSVSAAVVSGSTVVLTTDGQTGGMVYTVTVAGSVTDIYGAAVDPASRTAGFTGYVQEAVLVINELNANIANGCDLVELRVIQGGSMNGIQLGERDVPVQTFGDFPVQANDIIVLHFNGSSASCNPSASGNETSGKAQYPSATYTANYDAAYDWYTTDAGLTNTDNVLTLYSAAGAVLDAVLASDDPTGTAATASESQAAAVAAAGQWTMVGGGIPVGGFVDDNFNAHAVQDLNATGTTAAGTSIQRLRNLDSNTVDDWTMGVSSWGAMNAGQTAY